MRIKCFTCEQPVSSEVPEGSVVRGTVECPECCEKAPEPRYREALEEIQKVLSGSLTVQRPLLRLISGIVEKALKRT